MYPGSWARLRGVVFVNWPRYRGERTLGDLAARLIALDAIRDGDVVVGASLGGLVGCEIAERVQLSRAILIGGALSSREINPLFRGMGHLAPLVPLEVSKPLARQFRFPLVQMFADAEVTFVRAMADAILHWKGHQRNDRRIERIHGTRDVVIPPPPRADLLLSGGHLLSMTHADTCVQFVARSLGAQAGSNSGLHRHLVCPECDLVL